MVLVGQGFVVEWVDETCMGPEMKVDSTIPVIEVQSQVIVAGVSD